MFLPQNHHQMQNTNVLWLVDLLLGNDRETTIQQPLISNSSADEHVSAATREYSNNGRVVSYAVRADML
jgi:hypothetical protein